MKISTQSLEGMKAKLGSILGEISGLESLSDKSERQNEYLAELRENFRTMERQYRVFSKS